MTRAAAGTLHAESSSRRAPLWLSGMNGADMIRSVANLSRITYAIRGVACGWIKNHLMKTQALGASMRRNFRFRAKKYLGKRFRDNNAATEEATTYKARTCNFRLGFAHKLGNANPPNGLQPQARIETKQERHLTRIHTPAALRQHHVHSKQSLHYILWR